MSLPSRRPPDLDGNFADPGRELPGGHERDAGRVRGLLGAPELTDAGATSLALNAWAGQTLAMSFTVECQFLAAFDNAVESGFVASVDGAVTPQTYVYRAAARAPAS